MYVTSSLLEFLSEMLSFFDERIISYIVTLLFLLAFLWLWRLFLACKEYGGMFDESFPTHAFSFFFLSGNQIARTKSTL